MRVAVLGAGAVGCLFAHALAEVAEVRLVCRRPEQAAAIARDGLAMTADDGAEAIRRVETAVSGETHPPADLVLVCVKSYDTEAAVAANLSLFGAETVAATLQNGLGNDAALARFVPPERLVAGTLRGNSRRLDDRRFRRGGAGAVRLGGAAAEPVAALLRRAGFDAAATAAIRPLIWDKLFVNLAINPLTALHRVPNGRVAEDPALWRTAEAVIREAVAVAAREGMTFDEAAVLDSVRAVSLATADDYSSMEQDLAHGRRTEIDALNGALTVIAARHGLAVPVNAALADAVRRAEATAAI